MFVSFLLPFIDRGAGPIYHWIMLAQMASFDADEIAFVGDASYFVEDDVPFGEVLRVGGIVFTCPDKEHYRSFQKYSLGQTLREELYSDGLNDLQAFEVALTKVLPSWVSAINTAIQELVGLKNLEGILTWCNCPSLTEVARQIGNVAVIHNEVGPLRSPLYIDTIYFDFKGVNGRTTPSQWAMPDLDLENEEDFLTIEQIRGLLVTDPAFRISESSECHYDVGVALQVQDDSNIIAFSNSWNEISLLYDAMKNTSPANILVRSHPSARFVYNGGFGDIDRSGNSLEFLSKVDKVVSINSSILVEAALWGKPFEIKGDSPARCFTHLCMAESDSGPNATKLYNAFFLGYLVPATLLFDPDYYRWRLGGRTLAECQKRHRSEYLNISGVARQDRDGILGFELKAPQNSNSYIKTRAIWSGTLSLDRRLAALSDELNFSKNQELKWRTEAEANWRELETKDAELARWQSEAESNWVRLEECRAAAMSAEDTAEHWRTEAEANWRELETKDAELARWQSEVESVSIRYTEQLAETEKLRLIIESRLLIRLKRILHRLFSREIDER